MVQATPEHPIRRELRRQGRTQAWLARELGLRPNSLYCKLAGIRPFQVREIQRVADLLGVPVADLIPTEEADRAA